jgi:VanZ family protein
VENVSGRRRAGSVTRLLPWIPPLVWAAIILLLSAQPASRLPESGWAHGDKLAHGVIYGLLGALLARAALTAGLRPLLSLVLAAGGAAGFGLIDEWSQSFSPGRHPSAADLVADAVGALVGAAIVVGLWRIRSRRLAAGRSRP